MVANLSIVPALVDNLIAEHIPQEAKAVVHYNPQIIIAMDSTLSYTQIHKATEGLEVRMHLPSSLRQEAVFFSQRLEKYASLANTSVLEDKKS